MTSLAVLLSAEQLAEVRRTELWDVGSFGLVRVPAAGRPPLIVSPFPISWDDRLRTEGVGLGEELTRYPVGASLPDHVHGVRFAAVVLDIERQCHWMVTGWIPCFHAAHAENEATRVVIRTGAVREITPPVTEMACPTCWGRGMDLSPPVTSCKNRDCWEGRVPLALSAGTLTEIGHS